MLWLNLLRVARREVDMSGTWAFSWATLVVALALTACSSDESPDDAAAGSGGGGSSFPPSSSSYQPSSGASYPGCMGMSCDDGNPCTKDSCPTESCLHLWVDELPPGISDPDPSDCLVPACVDGELGEEPAPSGPCTLPSGAPGVCGVDGFCGCVAQAAVDPRWVDAVDGVDDDLHGGAPGACAYKTLSYAVSQGDLEIHVAPGSYDAAGGEAFPILLFDFQRILCEAVEGNRPLITGGGTYTTYTATIVASGAGNVIDGCDIVGVGEPTYCIDSTGATLAGILFQGNDISGCLNGIRLATGGAEIEGNTIHDNGLTGVHVQEGDDSAITSNVFSGNPTDIHCNPGMGWPTLVGAGNQAVDGPLVCAACDGCPFE
jgi:parallel beta-helix repeat protein